MKKTKNSKNVMPKNFKYWSGEEISKPDPKKHENCILVVGSNPTGWHGAGLALIAKTYWGAIQRQGRGLSGKSYLLPTKNLSKNFYEKQTGITYSRTGFRSISSTQIRTNIVELYEVALSMPEKWFIVPYRRFDRNLNGYSADFMFELFTKDIQVPRNVVFHESWKGYYY
ncbi:hypothetical protein [Vibrio sp. D431a]|uniref:A1S_2505 family phage non-structural protein n=1 Tax=Vibrio sp. D431a TaxID=2837388 RepID=UPI002555D1F1|nr:hypothetical protein [Vibrio sp. D431a]MDK9790708.1 hypothetical protein [Vibrio sp. D431a]